MAINSKSTKAEILAAYKALDKEKRALQAAQRSNNVIPASNRPVATNGNTPINTMQQLQQKDIAKTIKILEQLQSGFGGAVGNLSEQLIAEATTLEEIRASISEEKIQLKQLHEIEETDEETIDELIQQYRHSYKDFSEEYTAESEQKRQEIAELIQNWRKEQEQHQRDIKLRNEEAKKNKQRDAEEYQYNLDLARDLDEEAYEQEKKAKYQELDTVRQELEQAWQEKESEISKQEKAHVEAKEQVAEFTEKLRKKVRQGEEEGKGIGAYQTKIKLDLRRKEIEGEEQNYQLRIQSLQQTIDSQEERIYKLNQQLDLAQKQVQDLAVKAIEGTANRQSYEAMKEIAMEQAKTQQKGK